MLKQSILIAILMVLMVNLVSSIEVNMIQPQQGNVNEENIYPKVIQFCDVDWQCTPWRECIEGYKKRICVDAHSCQYPYNSPITKLACTEKVPRESVNSTMQWFIFWFFTSILLLILMIILIGLRR